MFHRTLATAVLSLAFAGCAGASSPSPAPAPEQPATSQDARVAATTDTGKPATGGGEGQADKERRCYYRAHVGVHVRTFREADRCPANIVDPSGQNLSLTRTELVSRDDPTLAVALLVGERRTGDTTKRCIYRRRGRTFATAISSAEICPASHQFWVRRR